MSTRGFDKTAIQSVMKQAFDRARIDIRAIMPDVEYERCRDDFAFHLFDCFDDFESLIESFRSLDGLNPEEAVQFLMGFLYHVVPHLNAAGALLLGDIPTSFSVPDLDSLLDD